MLSIQNVILIMLMTIDDEPDHQSFFSFYLSLFLSDDKKNNKHVVATDTATIKEYKRMKLDYEEIDESSSHNNKIVGLWDRTLREKDKFLKPKVDDLTDAVKAGVPRFRRGDVWLLLAERRRIHQENSDDLDQRSRVKREKEAGKLHPYRQLLNQLTPQQHAILVDLGKHSSHSLDGHTYLHTLSSLIFSSFQILTRHILTPIQILYTIFR